MNEIFKLILSLSISGSIVAIILFVLKPLLKDKFSKVWHYYIWLIVIARFILPFTIQNSFIHTAFIHTESYLSFQTEAQNQQANVPIVAINTLQDTGIQSISLSDNTVQKSRFSYYWDEIQNYIWIIWISIAILIFVQKIIGYRDFIQFIKAGRRDITDSHVLEIYKNACTISNINKPLAIYTNKLASAPMLVGIIRPFIILPSLELSDDEIYNILAHELTHYKRMDIFYKWLTQFAVCLHWFNPLVYRISNEINRNCELSCDESIIKKLNIEEKRSYGNTLIASLNLNGNYINTITSVSLNEDASLLKERLESIMKFKRKPKISIIFSIISMILIVAGTTFTGAYVITETTDKQEMISLSMSDSVQPQSSPALDNSPEDENISDFVLSPSSLYLNESTDINIQQNATQMTIVQPTSSVNSNTRESDAHALDIIKKTGNWRYVESLLPNMSTVGVDIVALETMQKTGNWNHVESMLPYMSNNGIDRVVTLWNQKHSNHTNKSASSYYNAVANNTINEEVQFGIENNYDKLALRAIQETNDLNDIVVLASLISTEVLDNIVTSRVITASDFNKTYALRQHMSTNGIDKLVKDYIDRTHDFGTVGAMLQFMSEEASSYVATKYFQSSDRLYDWIFSPYMK